MLQCNIGFAAVSQKRCPIEIENYIVSIGEETLFLLQCNIGFAAVLQNQCPIEIEDYNVSIGEGTT